MNVLVFVLKKSLKKISEKIHPPFPKAQKRLYIQHFYGFPRKEERGQRTEKWIGIKGRKGKSK